MTTGAELKPHVLSARQQHGRAVNSVADLLRRKLAVPKIFLEPSLRLLSADVLAVDRDGSGDLHAVEIKMEKTVPSRIQKNAMTPKELNERYREWYSVDLKALVGKYRRQLMSLPAHFRYLAIPSESVPLLAPVLAELGLYPPDGIGRIGIIAVHEKGNEAPEAEIFMAPERFRVEAEKMITIDRFLTKARPDIEIRI